MMSIIEQIRTRGFVKQIPKKTRVRFALLIRKPALCNKVRKQFMAFKKDPYKYIESIRDDADLFRVICLMRMMPPKRLLASSGIKYAVRTRDPLVLHLMAFYGLPFPEIFTFKPKVLLENLYSTLAPSLYLFIELNRRLPKLIAVDEIVDYVPAVIRNWTIENIIVGAFEAGKLLTADCPVRDPKYVLEVISNAINKAWIDKYYHAIRILSKRMTPAELDLVPDKLQRVMIEAVAAERAMSSSYYREDLPKDPAVFFKTVPSEKQLRFDSIYDLINYIYDYILGVEDFIEMRGSVSNEKLAEFLWKTSDVEAIDAVIRAVNNDDKLWAEIVTKFDSEEFVEAVKAIEKREKGYFDLEVVSSFILSVLDEVKIAEELDKTGEDFLDILLPTNDPDFYMDPESEMFAKLARSIAISNLDPGLASSTFWEYTNGLLDDDEAVEALRTMIEECFGVPDGRLRHATTVAKYILTDLNYYDLSYSQESFDFVSELPLLFKERISRYIIDEYPQKIDVHRLHSSLTVDANSDSWSLFEGEALVSPHGADILRNPSEQDKLFGAVPPVDELLVPVDEDELEDKVSKLKEQEDLYEYYKEQLSFNKGSCYAAYNSDGFFDEGYVFEYGLLVALDTITTEATVMYNSYNGSEDYDRIDSELCLDERKGLLDSKVVCAATINIASGNPVVVESKVRSNLFLRDVLKTLLVGKTIRGIEFSSIEEVNPVTFVIRCTRSTGDVFVASASDIILYLRPTLVALGFDREAINSFVDDLGDTVDESAPIQTVNYTKKPGTKSLAKYLRLVYMLMSPHGLVVPQESLTTVRKRKATELQVMLSDVFALPYNEDEDVLTVIKPELVIRAMQVFRSSFYAAVKKTAMAAKSNVLDNISFVVSTNPVDLFGASASLPVSISSCQSIVNLDGSTRVFDPENSVALPELKSGFGVTNDFIVAAALRYGYRSVLARFLGTSYISPDDGNPKIYLSEGGNIYGNLPSKEFFESLGYNSPLDELQDEVDSNKDMDTAYKHAAVNISEARAVLRVILDVLKKSPYHTTTKPKHSNLYA